MLYLQRQQFNGLAPTPNDIPVSGETSASPEEGAPSNYNDIVLAGFRKGYREDATTTAQKTLTAGQSATETILQMAGWIQDMKSRLKRKEFSVFVKGLLQWVGDEVRPYLDIVRAFDGFDLSRLVNLEPFTLLKLRSKRYAPVVEKLRDVADITPKIVQELIGKLLPKQSKKKQDQAISAWKPCRSGGGRYYQVQLHDEQTGLLIEQQAQESGLLPEKVIAEAVALRAKYKASALEVPVEEAGVVAAKEKSDIVQPPTEEVEESASTESGEVELQQMEEAVPLTEDSDSIDEVTIVQAEVEQYWEEEEQAAAFSVVSEGTVLAGEDEIEIQWLLNAPIHEVEAVMPSVPVQSAYRALYLLNQFQSGDEKRMELLEERVSEHHTAVKAVKPPQAIVLEQVSEQLFQRTQVTALSEAEQVFLCLELASENYQASVLASGSEEYPLHTKAEPRVFQEGERVEIVSDRHGEELFWQVGVVSVAGDVGCVVNVADKILWFGNEELVLVPATPPTPLELEKAHYQRQK